MNKSKESFRLTLPSDPRQVARVEKFLERVNQVVCLDDTRYNKLLVATTEAVNNGILHGNKNDPHKSVTLVCEVHDKVLIVSVEDEGGGVDPSKLPDPLSEENLLRENGRGVFLMRSLMNSVEFAKTPSGSVVVMTMKMN